MAKIKYPKFVSETPKHTILVMSPEDVYTTFKEEIKREPTEEEFNNAWNKAVRNSDNTYIMDGFWENIKQACQDSVITEDSN